MLSPPLRAYLSAISELRHEAPTAVDQTCKLCGARSPHFDSVDFNKSCGNAPLGRSAILVEYFRCPRCELIFTDFCDDWSKDDFSAFIYNDDYILVDPEYVGIRALRTAEALAPALAGAEHKRILDYGSGSGVFAKEMNKRGFAHVESYDPIVHSNAPTGRFDLVTCFEVIEHSASPKETLGELIGYLEDDGVALVGQALQPDDIAEVRGLWWYIAPRNGHVTTYSNETIRIYAEANGLIYDHFGTEFALSRPERSDLSRIIIERFGPRDWRRVLAAPPPGDVQLVDWDQPEVLDGKMFRWSLEREVGLGMHSFPAGKCRVVVPYHIPITHDFLEEVSIRIGGVEKRMTARSGELIADVYVPDTRAREVLLRTPPPVSPTSLGVAEDSRRLGVAVWCA